MLRHLLPVLLTLSSTAFAGGAEPLLDRDQPLHWVPGLLLVSAVPASQISIKGFTNALMVNAAGRHIQIFVTTGIVDANSNASAIDNILLWVPSATASELEKQALISVARTYLRGCFPNVTPQQLEQLSAVQKTNWQGASWQEKTVQGLKIGWSSGQGFAFTDERGRSKERAALSLIWPAKASRCQF